MLYPAPTYPVAPERDDDLYDLHRDAERETGPGQSGCSQSPSERRDSGPGSGPPRVSPAAVRPGSRP